MNPEEKAIACVVVLFMWCCGFGIGAGVMNSHWKNEALTRGCAGYDERTGEFKWKSEPKPR